MKEGRCTGPISLFRSGNDPDADVTAGLPRGRFDWVMTNPPFHAGKTYFSLELSAEDQAQLERSGGFAFHVSGDFTGLELKFWAVRD